MPGLGDHDIPVLIAARLLNPLGDPQANATKYFSTVQILEMAGNRDTLHKIRRAIYGYWRGKKRSSHQPKAHFAGAAQR
jgi:hypothetical protein